MPGPSKAEMRRRERVCRLVAWLRAQHGFREAPCPRLVEMTGVIGRADPTIVRETLRRAEMAGALVWTGRSGRGRPMLRLVPGWDPASLLGAEDVPPAAAKPAAVKIPTAAEPPPPPPPAPPPPAPAASVRREAATFARWLATAAAGERYDYFKGHLGTARTLLASGSLPADEAAQLLEAIRQAEAAAEAEVAGLVLLLTRRVDGELVYMAQRTAAPFHRTGGGSAPVRVAIAVSAEDLTVARQGITPMMAARARQLAEICAARAQHGLPTPTNREIQSLFGVRGEMLVTRALETAEALGLLVVERRGRYRAFSAPDGRWHLSSVRPTPTAPREALHG